MKFKNEIRFKYGSLKRGDECLVNSVEAVFLGSYYGKTWKHMFLVENWDGSDVVITITDLNKVTTANKKAPEVEGQLMLC